MKFKLFILIVTCGFSFAVLAQDLGPVGPKKTIGDKSKPHNSSTNSPVNLPYKPANQEKVEGKSPKANKTEPEVKPAPKKEFVIPNLAPQYPPSAGAPDFGL